MLAVDFQVAPFNSISFSFFRSDFLVLFFHRLVSGPIMCKAEYKRAHGEGCGRGESEKGRSYGVVIQSSSNPLS